VARVQLDGGEDSLTGWGSRSSSSKGRCAGSICSRGNCGKRCSSIGSRGNSSKRCSGISGNWGSSQRSNGGSSIRGRGKSSSVITIGSWETIAIGSVVQTSIGSIGKLSISRALGFLGSIESLEKLSLGSSNLSGVSHGKRCNTSVHGSSRCDTIEHRGNGEIVAGHTEAKGISNVVDSVNTSLILVGVGASNTSVGIATLLLGTVDVLVTISNISVFILSLELRADGASDRGSSHSRDSMDSSHSRGSYSNRGTGVSSSIGGSWERGSGSVGGHWGCGGDGGGSQGPGVEGCDGGAVGKLGVNSSWAIGSIRAGIGTSCEARISLVETGSTQVLGSDGELGLSGTDGQEGGDNSEELHGVTSPRSLRRFEIVIVI
jgi:hypothetical protein